MIEFVIEEWVAMMPAETVKSVVENIKDEKLYYMHIKAVESNIESGYRPDFIDLFS